MSPLDRCSGQSRFGAGISPGSTAPPTRAPSPMSTPLSAITRVTRALATDVHVVHEDRVDDARAALDDHPGNRIERSTRPAIGSRWRPGCRDARAGAEAHRRPVGALRVDDPLGIGQVERRPRRQEAPCSRRSRSRACPRPASSAGNR